MLCRVDSMPSLVDCVLGPRGDQASGAAAHGRSPLGPAAGPSPWAAPASQVRSWHCCNCIVSIVQVCTALCAPVALCSAERLAPAILASLQLYLHVKAVPVFTRVCPPTPKPLHDCGTHRGKSHRRLSCIRQMMSLQRPQESDGGRADYAAAEGDDEEAGGAEGAGVGGAGGWQDVQYAAAGAAFPC